MSFSAVKHKSAVMLPVRAGGGAGARPIFRRSRTGPRLFYPRLRHLRSEQLPYDEDQARHRADDRRRSEPKPETRSSTVGPAAKDLRQQGNGIKRDGQTSPA